MSEIIYKIEIGKKYNIKGNDIIINISPINSTFLNSYIDLNLIECDENLKKNYNMSSSDIITFIYIKKNTSNLNLSENEIEYLALDNNKINLDLSLCKEENKNLNIISDTISSSDNNPSNNAQIIIYLNQTKEELIKNITKLIENIEIEKTYEMKGEDFTVKISPTNASSLSNSTHVNFTKCENILRNHYNISSSRYITFLQLEIYNQNSQILINKLEYQAYDDNKNLLNLSICDENIKIIHSIKSSSLFDDIQASLFQDLGIDIFNINDSFFTDVCHSYSDSENDLTLKDRIKDIFQNYSLCEEGCSYDEIDIGNLTITCDCKVKTNISMEEIKVNLYKYEEKSANFHIIKCYDLVFSFKDKFNNIGFWIFLVLILLHIPLLILFLCQGIKPIKDYINKEMVKYGYINEKEATELVDNENDIKKSNNSKKINKIKRKKNNEQNSSPPKKNNKKKTAKNIIYQRKNNQTNNNNANIKNKNFKNKKQKIKQSSKNNSLNTKSIINNLIDSKIINILPTQERKKKRKNKIFKKIKKQKIQVKNEYETNNFTIININLNKGREYIPQNSSQILNNYTFKEAIKYDLRSVLLIYYIILLSKQAIFHAFLFKSPLELFSLRLCLFFFIYSSDIALNAFFYLDDKISEKYNQAKNLFLFAFYNNITVILLSTLVGFVFMALFTNLGNSSNQIRNVFRNEEERLIKNTKYKITKRRKIEILNEINNILRRFRIKVFILFNIEFLLMLFFWYYVTAFCHVYKSTQYSWLFDSFLSILSRTIIDFLVPLLFAKLYRISVESNAECLYKIVMFYYSFA